jgi:hypothetical protein
MRKSEMEKLIKPSDLRAEAQRLISTGRMPSLEALLGAVADVRQKYQPLIVQARMAGVEHKADVIRARGLSVKYRR